MEHAIDGFRPILTTKANEAVRLAVCASSGILPIGHAEEWLTRGGPWVTDRKPSNCDELTAKIKIGCVRAPRTVELAIASIEGERLVHSLRFSHLPERDGSGRRLRERMAINLATVCRLGAALARSRRGPTV